MTEEQLIENETWRDFYADREADWAGPGFSTPYVERHAEPEAS